VTVTMHQCDCAAVQLSLQAAFRSLLSTDTLSLSLSVGNDAAYVIDLASIELFQAYQTPTHSLPHCPTPLH